MSGKETGSQVVTYGLADPGDFNKALGLMADILVRAGLPGKGTAAAAG